MTDRVPDPSQIEPRVYRNNPTATAMGYFIFASRWLQAPLYVGLILAQLIYVIVFGFDLMHLAQDVWNGIFHVAYVDENGVTQHHELSEASIMLAVLGLIDVVMIANLLIMVIIGGYEIFVSRIKVDGHPDEPDWLSHVNANLLKIKLAISIISISSIHLLKTFIEVGDLGAATESETGAVYTWDGVMWQVIIHMAFIFSALALAWIDKMSHGVAPVGSKAAKKLAQRAGSAPS